MRYVVPLDMVRTADVARVGAKATGLGSLIEASFPVPEGVCVTTDAFRLALEQKQDRIGRIVLEHDLVSPAGASEAARALADVLADLHVPEAVLAALREALGLMQGDGTPMAVRSSATAEDQADASFAGQYATVLGVRSEEALTSAILECWRSFFSPHALVARTAYGALSGAEGMGVIVQKMIDAECAGVCFSVDPVEHRRELIVIDAAWGLGAGAVDGTVATDTHWLHRHGFTTEKRQIAEKPEKIALCTGGGIEQVPVPEAQRRAACLPKPWAQRVAQFAVAAENLMGYPQDLEWAIADRKLWVLQSRPVTALPPELSTVPEFPVSWDSEDDARLYWQHEEVSRHWVPLPLEHDVNDIWVRGMYDAENFHGRPISGRVKVMNGRRYFTIIPSKLRKGDVRVRQAAKKDLNRRLLQEHGVTTWDYWGPEVIKATERLRAFDATNADGKMLAEHLEEALGVFRRHWMVHWLLGHVEPLLDTFLEAHAALTGSSEKPSEEAVMHLLDGEETSLTRLIDGLYTLAESARGLPTIAALVEDPPADVMECLSALPEAAAFTERLERFLNTFGDRTGAGFGSITSLRDPTWRENPAQVLKLVAPYLDPRLEAPSVARHRAKAQRDAQVEALCSACKDEHVIMEFRRQLELARKNATILEEHNYYIDQLSTAQLRAAIMAAARHLATRDLIASADEVFWLQIDEIVTALQDEQSEPFAAIISEHQTQHARWSAMQPPPFLGLPKPELDERPPLANEVTVDTQSDTNLLRSKGASPGRHRGRARVVTGHVILPDVQPGDVLIAENAGPLWTPIFPLLGALVLDQGAVMQHATATAREYGVPAVIGTSNATKRILDGSWVTVDGTAGTVELEEAETLLLDSMERHPAE